MTATVINVVYSTMECILQNSQVLNPASSPLWCAFDANTDDSPIPKEIFKGKRHVNCKATEGIRHPLFMR